MKEITLTKGYTTMVDDSDYDWLNQFNWHVCVKKCGHASAVKAPTLKDSHTKMHRLILGITDPKVFVDHKDRNPLNNQRSNLRPCSRAQNVVNTESRKNSTSKYLGVSLASKRNTTGVTWQSIIGKDKKKIYLGRFQKEELAALAYNKAAIEMYGEFARLNIIHI